MATSAAPFAGGYPAQNYNATAFGAELTVQAPTASTKRVVLTGMTIGLSAAAAVQFKDGNGGTVIFTTPILAANTPYTIDLGNGVACTANANLRAISTAAANLSGTIFTAER